MHPAHLRPLFSLALSALLLTGCVGEQSKTSFKLTLVPVLPPSQADLFEDIDGLLIRVDDGAGTVDEYELSAERGTSPAIEGLGALAEGVTVELEGYRGDTLVARGISEPLTIKRRERVTVEIYVSALDEMATFNSLEDPSLGAAIASDGAGNFYIFGGTDEDWYGEPVDAIQRWSLVPPGGSFTPTTVASFPVYSDVWVSELGARTQCTATLLAEGDHDDLGKILVTGGWEGFDGPDTVGKQAFLFDPSAEPGQAIELIGTTNTDRSDHLAVALGSGDVVIFGGYSWNDSTSSTNLARRVEVYHAADRAFVQGDEVLDRGLVDGAAARLGDTALYCGGGDWSSSSYHAYGDCIEADRNGQASSIDGPPQLQGAGLLLPAMVRLGSTSVLLTGGAVIADTPANHEWSEASNAAYIYDSDTLSWRGAAPMFVARAGHVSAALPDGRVLVAGGASSVRTHGLWGEDLLACAEIYDPGADAWTELNPGCGNSTSIGSLPEGLLQPSVAVDPYYGVLIWGGISQSGSSGTAQPTYALFSPFPE